MAFIGSLGHCIGMCGGFVVAYSSSKINTKKSPFSQFFLHLLYNLGRVSSYAFMGAIFGFLGQALTFSHEIAGYVYFVVGILMVLMGLSLLGKLRFLTSIESSLAMHPKVKSIFSYLMKTDKKSSFYLLGMLNGFLPCGLVYFFLISAVATASWFWGMTTMLVFGVATMPSLLGFGFVVGFLKGSAFRELMIKIASFVIILYGIYMAYIGFMATQKAGLIN